MELKRPKLDLSISKRNLVWPGVLLLHCCQTPNLVLGLGVDFTFPYNKKKKKKKKKNKNKNPHLIFHRREDTRGLK